MATDYTFHGRTPLIQFKCRCGKLVETKSRTKKQCDDCAKEKKKQRIRINNSKANAKRKANKMNGEQNV